jgi:glutamate synthase (NADPH/NADH) large chain
MQIARKCCCRHRAPSRSRSTATPRRPADKYQWRADGEFHLFNPDDPQAAEGRAHAANYGLQGILQAGRRPGSSSTRCAALLDFKLPANPMPIEEVESVESIMKRFKTGAMSYGSISRRRTRRWPSP